MRSKKSKTDPKLSTDRFELEGPYQELGGSTRALQVSAPAPPGPPPPTHTHL
jgi:hypothetical protein